MKLQARPPDNAIDQVSEDEEQRELRGGQEHGYRLAEHQLGIREALAASASHVRSCRSEAIAAAAVIVTTTRSAYSSARHRPT